MVVSIASAVRVLAYACNRPYTDANDIKSSGPCESIVDPVARSSLHSATSIEFTPLVGPYQGPAPTHTSCRLTQQRQGRTQVNLRFAYASERTHTPRTRPIIATRVFHGSR